MYQGRVVRCRHVDGKIHALGLEFDVEAKLDVLAPQENLST
ncbi:MAG: hypothetical protein QF785_11890 [Phycisphaeraceae bacterium]|nr:hypothetical protein [Phycisphaeraceae bacterium]MDP7346837.1 hypothetical protein [Phycisphaeraceae bacterium]